METEKGLLETLADKIGCMYLSDLRQISNLAKIQKELKEIPHEKFPLREWNDAAEYITGKEDCFSASIEAKEYLLAYKKYWGCALASKSMGIFKVDNYSKITLKKKIKTMAVISEEKHHGLYCNRLSFSGAI